MKLAVLPLLTLLALPAAAQEKAPAPQAANPVVNPMLAFDREAFAHIKGLILKSAEKMPEEGYAFRPVETVRTYGQILAHVADAQYLFGSILLGVPNPAPRIEKTRTTKAEILAALKEAFAYSEKAINGLDETSATQTVKMFGGDTPKAGVVAVDNIHNMEHYGNLTTYLRMKGLVPPSSEQAPPPAAQH